MIHVIFTKGFDRGSVVDAFSWSAKVVGRFLFFVGGASPASGRFANRPYVASPSQSEGEGVRLSNHRRVGFGLARAKDC